MESINVYKTLNAIDISEYLKDKNGFKYLPWSAAWDIVLAHFPDATYSVVKSEEGCIYHTDGRTCWVETTVTINGITRNETLAVLNHRNQPIALDTTTSFNAGNSVKRCLVKNLALFGLGLSLWVGEELSEAARSARAKKSMKLSELRDEIVELCKRITSTSPESKDTLYTIIETYNGSKNPNSIKSEEVCVNILNEIRERFEIE